MPIVESTIEIQADATELFDLSQDYALRTTWDPFVREMRFLHGAQVPEVGTQVWVKAHNRLTMEVEFVVMNRPHTVAMKMTRGPFFFERFAGTWKFKSTAQGTTVVTFRYNFRVKGLRLLMDPIITLLFKRDVRLRLEGLKRAVEQSDILKRLPSSPLCPC